VLKPWPPPNDEVGCSQAAVVVRAPGPNNDDDKVAEGHVCAPRLNDDDDDEVAEGRA
jgi:hypothetical protein